MDRNKCQVAEWLRKGWAYCVEMHGGTYVCCDHRSIALVCAQVPYNLPYRAVGDFAIWAPYVRRQCGGSGTRLSICTLHVEFDVYTRELVPGAYFTHRMFVVRYVNVMLYIGHITRLNNASIPWRTKQATWGTAATSDKLLNGNSNSWSWNELFSSTAARGRSMEARGRSGEARGGSGEAFRRPVG